VPLPSRARRLARASRPVGVGVLVLASLWASSVTNTAFSQTALTSASSGGDGYWLVASDGGVFTYGDAAFHGSAGGIHLNKPIVGMAVTPDGLGYWLVASDGGVFTYGDATFHGSAGGIHLNDPVVAAAATPDGRGYWLVASDGGIFTYGDAVFHGSAGSQHLNAAIVGMTPTPDGGGYWLVASDGGIFAYGDAVFYGSAGSLHLNAPIIGMAATPDGGGYWLVASDGGVFTYGDAAFHGSAGGTRLNTAIVAVADTPDGGGYWLVASDGGVFTYGDASFLGSMGGIQLNKPVVAMAALGWSAGPTSIPPTTTTTTSDGLPTCVTGDSDGLPISGAYHTPDIINNSNGYNTYVNINMWGNIDSTGDKLCGTGPGNWTFTTTEADGPDGGAVQGYPDVQQLYNDWNGTSDGNTPISQSGAPDVTSTFSTTDPPVSQGQWELAYDLWSSDYPTDIMVWEDVATARGAISNYGGATIDNPDVVIDGVHYTLIHYGSGAQPERMLVAHTNVTSGSIDLRDIMLYMENAGLVPMDNEFTQIQLGWEVCDTDGVPASFGVNGFTLTRTPVEP
jgi:hypothetical protein